MIYKKDIVNVISAKTGTTKVLTEQIIDCALDIIVSSLKINEKVCLTNFGVFELKMRKARTGLNPHTKEPVHIPERPVPVFKPAAKLKSFLLDI